METQKSEIEKMPEGMSSEELDALTTGEEVEQPEKLAEETLEATDEPSPAEEPAKEEPEAEEKPPEPGLTGEQQQLRAKDSKIASQKHTVRELELDKARLEGELKARESIAVKPEEVPKSPLEIAEAAYIEEYGELPEGGLPFSGELYRKQQEFDNTQVAAKTATKEKAQTDSVLLQTATALQEGDLSAGKMGEGLDLQSVATVGDKYLTKGDRVDLVDIQATRGTAAAMKEAYKIMVRRTLNAGNEDSKLLKTTMAKKSQTKPPKEPKKPTDIDALTTEGVDADTGEAETVTHSSRLTSFMFDPD